VRFSTIAANAGMEAVLTDLQYEKKIWKQYSLSERGTVLDGTGYRRLKGNTEKRIVKSGYD